MPSIPNRTVKTNAFRYLGLGQKDHDWVEISYPGKPKWLKEIPAINGKYVPLQDRQLLNQSFDLTPEEAAVFANTRYATADGEFVKGSENYKGFNANYQYPYKNYGPQGATSNGGYGVRQQRNAEPRDGGRPVRDAGDLTVPDVYLMDEQDNGMLGVANGAQVEDGGIRGAHGTGNDTFMNDSAVTRRDIHNQNRTNSVFHGTFGSGFGQPPDEFGGDHGGEDDEDDDDPGPDTDMGSIRTGGDTSSEVPDGWGNGTMTAFFDPVPDSERDRERHLQTETQSGFNPFNTGLFGRADDDVRRPNENFKFERTMHVLQRPEGHTTHAPQMMPKFNEERESHAYATNWMHANEYGLDNGMRWQNERGELVHPEGNGVHEAANYQPDIIQRNIFGGGLFANLTHTAEMGSGPDSFFQDRANNTFFVNEGLKQHKQSQPPPPPEVPWEQTATLQRKPLFGRAEDSMQQTNPLDNFEAMWNLREQQLYAHIGHKYSQQLEAELQQYQESDHESIRQHYEGLANAELSSLHADYARTQEATAAAHAQIAQMDRENADLKQKFHEQIHALRAENNQTLQESAMQAPAEYAHLQQQEAEFMARSKQQMDMEKQRMMIEMQALEAQKKTEVNQTPIKESSMKSVKDREDGRPTPKERDFEQLKEDRKDQQKEARADKRQEKLKKMRGAYRSEEDLRAAYYDHQLEVLREMEEQRRDENAKLMLLLKDLYDHQNRKIQKKLSDDDPDEDPDADLLAIDNTEGDEEKEEAADDNNDDKPSDEDLDNFEDLVKEVGNMVLRWEKAKPDRKLSGRILVKLITSYLEKHSLDALVVANRASLEKAGPKFNALVGRYVATHKPKKVV